MPRKPIRKPKTSTPNKKKSTIATNKSKKNSQIKQKKAVKTTVKEAGIKSTDFWTEKREKEFEEHLTKIFGYKNEDLKNLLQKNGQSKSGNKIDLLTRVADGMMFGSIPFCSNCGGGRPKLDLLSGVYYCKGYMDDDKWQYCRKSFDFEEIKRDKWKE